MIDCSIDWLTAFQPICLPSTLSLSLSVPHSLPLSLSFTSSCKWHFNGACERLLPTWLFAFAGFDCDRRCCKLKNYWTAARRQFWLINCCQMGQAVSCLDRSKHNRKMAVAQCIVSHFFGASRWQLRQLSHRESDQLATNLQGISHSSAHSAVPGNLYLSLNIILHIL